MILNPHIEDQFLSHLELHAKEGVCNVCRYVYWLPVGVCTSCNYDRHPLEVLNEQRFGAHA